MAVGIVTPQSLYVRIADGEELLILDVRLLEDFESWHVEGPTVTSVNIPYLDFLTEEAAPAWKKLLPADQPILVNCARGRSAQLVAEVLDRHGYEVAYLEGGMSGWSEVYAPVTVIEEPDWKLIQLNRVGKGCLSYLIHSGGTALVVDAGRHVEQYLALARAEGVSIVHVVDTHLHADHISGSVELAARTGAHYYISGSELQGSDIAHTALEDHRIWTFGAVTVCVLAIPTPGHTPGSVSLLLNNQYLLTGDTVFVGGLGRPDLGGKSREWAQLLYDTVFTTLAPLADDVLVLPAHYASRAEYHADGYVGAKLGLIRETNDALRLTDREAFVERFASESGATPPNYTEITSINRGDKQVDATRALELENGPNRCAAKHANR
ncbi:MBL fold metallo-hydrolase [Tumebacillus permanentifrigoris]|uniref:Glyoxylase-like metal-dependent hydrolase (Beta-lactamase superfamily II) n=1 Tax=Tumebacillus permanentifrigoris TaxID=378543 RepID=A0A316DXT0_9BACL|nr:MBL fold metallo-hydrolase [Tumebacillus permanentifrigoris]PWK14921.1 glyoxylase-like metal-dependent hydrolase (beta-lactamase superfamily II) [Tumebacillus permanentifrigoris]